jgi:hypothetical protein
MDQVLDFDVDFVIRTKEILNDYNGPRDMSIILNCLMGLVILPFEKVKSNPNAFWDTELTAIPNLPSFHQHIFEPIERLAKQNKQPILYPKTLRVFLRKMRNAICHQNIEAINKNEKFASVSFRNYFEPTTRQYLDMHIEFTQDELKTFALFVAEQYLK